MKSFLVLLVICLLGFAIRFYHVATIPKGTLVDEASFGYISQSLLETGKDEHSQSWPLVFTAFGDQKLPAYAYVLLPFIKIFGMNTFSVRLPSVVVGTFLIAVVYFLLVEVGFTRKQSLIGSLITSVAPWTIILSRFGYESNVGLLIYTLGLYFYFRFLNKKQPYLLALCALCMGLTWYAYISYRLVTMLLGAIIIAYSLWYKKATVKNAALYVLTFFVVILPLIPYAFGAAGVARFNQVGMFANSGYVLEINESRDFCRRSFPKIICYATINKGTIYARAIVYNYLETFSPVYLFTTGQEPSRQFGIDNFGLFPVILLPLYILGLVSIVASYRKKDSDKVATAVLLVGLIVGALPSVLVGLPQRIRLTPTFPFVLILLIFGLVYLEDYFKNHLSQKIILTVVVFGLLISSVFINLNFVVHAAKHEDAYGGYLVESMEYIASQPKDTKIYIRPFFSEPLMYYAYFTRMPASHYQQNVVLGEKEANGFQHAIKLDNLEITELPPEQLPCIRNQNKRELYVTNDDLFKLGHTKNKAVYEGRSENKALVYLQVYDMAPIGNGQTNCVTK